MDFKQIRYAVAVAKERSFTRAANRLNVSQSAISEQVKQLEEQVGFPLMSRMGSGVEMTEKGRVFLYEAELVANDLTYLLDVARRLRGVAVDKVSLGLISGLGQIILPKMFSSGGMSENVQLEIRTAPTRVIFSELHKGRLDIGIAIEVDPDLVPSGLTVKRLLEVELVLITPPDHPLAAERTPVDIGLIMNEPLIMSELSVGYGMAVLTMLHNLGVRPPIRAVVDNVETMKVLVQSGVGLALIPAGAADNEANLGLIKVLPFTPTQRLSIGSYTPRRRLSRHSEKLHAQVMGEPWA